MSILILEFIGLLLYVLYDTVTYFDSFGVEHIPKEIKKLIGVKNIKANIFRMQAYDSYCVDIFLLDILILCLQVKA